MAPSKKRNVNSRNTSENVSKAAKLDLEGVVDRILESRKHANDIFDVLESLQSEKERDVVSAVDACCRLFSTLLERKELFVGKLPAEDEALSGESSAEDKCRIFMRHRYNACVEILLEHLNHEQFAVKESALCCLMKFAAGQGQHPLEDLEWSQHHSFPRGIILVGAVVENLTSKTTDNTLLISRFQEFLEMDDVRYYVMSALRESVGKVMEQNKGTLLPVYQNNVFTLMSSISMPSQQSELSNFMVKLEAMARSVSIQNHKRAFEKMWLGFLKYKLPSNMYKKLLVILHDSILPHMSKPALMIDFLTAAYEVGGAISLLALNGLFVLIHQHNLDYPDFYKKLYNLLEPTVFHVKYRARFFHLANLFLSSSHLPLYLVAAFTKRLARLAVLLHKPSTEDEPVEDPYLMDEEDPAQCRALESSLWEIKTLQKHYHPDVAKAAMMINTPLSEQEEDISELLELTTYELMERDLKKPQDKKSIPLEFETATQLLKGGGDVLAHHFCLVSDE
uniref:Nucleolar complex associated 4 homolog n=1 Tax=Oryzias latipes TaxID=8090 RepID=A0A3P9IP55_ORYLA